MGWMFSDVRDYVCLIVLHPCLCHIPDSEQTFHVCFVGISEFQAPVQRKPGLGDRRTGGAAGVPGDGQYLSQVGRGVRAGVMEMGQVQVRKDLCCLAESREEALKGVTEQSHVRELSCLWANPLQ